MKSSIKIVCKKNALADGKFPIYLRITIDRKSKFYKIPYSCDLREWNEAKGRFNSKNSNYHQSNRVLSRFEDDASKILNELLEYKNTFTLIEFDNLYRQNSIDNNNFIEFLEFRIKQLYESKQISYSDSHNDTLISLRKFKSNIDKYSFDDIDYNFLLNYETFLRKTGCKDGGIGVYMRNIRATFNIAIKSKIAKQELYPFKDYKISTLKSQKIKKALTKEQLQNLIDFDIKKIPSAINARYLYLFSFYTRGMNFTDLAELRWGEIEYSKFSYKRNKTGINIRVKIPENDITNEILKFYKEYRPFTTDYIFPILKKDILDYNEEELFNRKHSVRSYYNKQLKLIFKELKIDTKINFYTARHTFATLSLRNGVQVSKIKQALGHQSIKTTESYLEDFKDYEIDEAFENLI
ncbi:site-specific integrase [Empedobacter falsenii]|uniref:Site-specific integrase n=1 Tax=Empedobacter falsenii TaxID=343874 RepID=A0A7H9DQH6_9FLAO|nr:site-specific integrase [Empedobacter falsenii]QLL57255.1 site-specific integrase [Empedobacter falsenii]